MKKKIVALALSLSLCMVVGTLAPVALADEKETEVVEIETEAVEIETEDVVVPEEDAIVDSQNTQNPQVENLEKVPVIKTGVLVIYRTRAGVRVGQELVMVPTYLTYVPKDMLKKVPAGYELIENVPVLRGVTLATAFVDPIETVDPDPENPDKPDPENPDKPDPENPDKPDPENPDKPDPVDPENPDKPDPENPDKPDPENPDKPDPVNPVDPVDPVDPAKPEVKPEVKPAEKPAEKSAEKPVKKETAKENTVPKTGDTSNTAVWFGLAALSGAAIVVSSRKRKDA